MPKIINDETIYKATMRVIMEKGYAGATTKQIAETAEISEVTLFRKYESKGNLVKKAIVYLSEQMDYEAKAKYTGDPYADLLQIVKMYQGSVEDSGRFFYTILLEISRNPELAEIVETPLSMMSHFGRMLMRYQKEGVLIEELPLHSVAALLGPLMITNMVRLSTPDVPLPAIDLETHVHNYLNGRSRKHDAS